MDTAAAAPAPAAPGFDILALDCATKAEEGVPMPIPHPGTGQPIKDAAGKLVTITLLGRHSETARAKLREIAVRNSERSARGETITPQIRDANETEFAAACCVGWSFTKMGGSDFTFSPENARRFFADPRFRWVRERAVEHINEDARFLAGC